MCPTSCTSQEKMLTSEAEPPSLLGHGLHVGAGPLHLRAGDHVESAVFVHIPDPCSRSTNDCCLKLLRPGLVCCEAIATETMGGSPRITLLELKACGDTLGEEGISRPGAAAHPSASAARPCHISLSKYHGAFSQVALESLMLTMLKQPMCQMEQKAGQSSFPFQGR